MNKSFYERCKKVVAGLDLSYEQGIARDVILNELDLLEKQAEDYQKRFNKAVEVLLCYGETFDNKIHQEMQNKLLNILESQE